MQQYEHLLLRPRFGIHTKRDIGAIYLFQITSVHRLVELTSLHPALATNAFEKWKMFFRPTSTLGRASPSQWAQGIVFLLNDPPHKKEHNLLIFSKIPFGIQINAIQ